MTTRAPLPLVALLACALATAVSSPAAAGTTAAARAHGQKARRKLRTILRRKGLAKLPSVAGALAARANGHGADVTGTPPTLTSIPDSTVENVFWRAGVVDAIANHTATGEQCGEFFAGQADGQSGGLGACHMAETVGYSVGEILSGDTSLCYMKRFPTHANLTNGALSLTSGAFPNGDPTRLFSVPAGATSRVVKVSVTGEEQDKDVFLRVHSQSENQAADDLYAVDLWFCPSPDAPPSGVDHIRITNAGEFTATEAQREATRANVSTVTGFVTFSDGEIVYDTTRGRRAQVASSDGTDGFKADHQIGADDVISSREYDAYGGSTHRSYVIASFSGGDVDSLRFLAGAFKERNAWNGGSQPDVTGSTEYRSTYYAASPGSPLESGLGDVSFDTDPFYAAPPSATVDPTGFSCTTPADVELALDFATDAGTAIKAQCEASRLYERMQFCHEDPAVQAAQQAYPSTCSGPH